MSGHSLVSPFASPGAGCMQCSRLWDEIQMLRGAIAAHHGQRADDRCFEDDDALYSAAGLPPCDRRVGTKEEMLSNCRRFIERRCESGGWPSYRELEAQIQFLRTDILAQRKREIEAGALCDLPYEWHGCDWPNAAAQMILWLRVNRR